MEVNLPPKYDGKTIKEIGVRENYGLLVLTTISHREEKSLIGKSRNINKVEGVASPNNVLNKNDILVVYGSNNDIKRFLKG